jgi:dienelactone hydrolase
MRLNHRVSFIVIYRFLLSFHIVLLALTGVANAQNPVPLINQPLVPDAVRPGSAGFTLTVDGTGFVSGSVVHWSGSARATTFVSKSQLKATILSIDVAKRSTGSVTVVNPSPGGGASNLVFFPVTPAVNLPFGGSVLAAGSSPLSAVTADFNGDGKLDLAIANHDGNNVTVFLGNGDGTFKVPVNYETGTNPWSGIAVGDFRGNGKLDLVVGNYGSNNVSVLLGNGDGSFQAAVNYETGVNPTWVAVGDFNGDGKLDLAVSDQNCTPTCGTGMFSILLGKGDGTFHPHSDYPAAVGESAPNGVAVGDFNGDGKLDLAVVNGNAASVPSAVSVLLGHGDGTFQAPVTYPLNTNGASIATADFNHDGKLDLVVVDNIGVVSILLGNGDGTFQSHVDYGADSFPWGCIGITDLNGDGNLDLAVANSGSNTVSIFLGNGNGTFQPQVEIATGAGPRGAIVGDFNGDGRLDLAVPNHDDNTLSILLQATTVTLLPTTLTFANQVVGSTSPAHTLTLTNTGPLTLTISGIAVTGTNATDFGQTHSCGSMLLPGAHCTISVTFKPTQVGSRTASVTINDNAVGSPQSVNLSGTGVVSGPNATLSPTSLTFATQLVGTSSSAQSITLSNYGTMALNITSIVASGDFSPNTCGSSLPAGASCTINVTFKPTQIGTRTGAVSITDNAPGSPQKVSLKGTGTVVEFNPTSLAFHCHNKPNNCPPPPQTITLTNTGSTTLSISNIAITGSTTFSQTNNCSTRVTGKGSCSITVAFKSSLRGTFSGAVLVSDNGGGSPQQVPLSATETKTGAGAFAVRSAMGAHFTASVPAPTGPMRVGTRVMDLVDPTRDDPFPADGTKRELLVRFWYPASLDQGCELAEYTSPAVWSYFSQLSEFPLPEVKTNSCKDAPATGGAHPVIVFTPGYTGTFTDYTFLFEDLASRGYVVASVDHTYEATAVEFPDGRFVMSVFGSHLAESTWRRDEQSLARAASARPKDLKFVVDELARLNNEASSPFTGKLDLTKVAVAGHSLGGLAALLGLKEDARFKAALLLDARLPDGSATLTKTPVLVLAMGREQWSDEECRLWGDLRGPRFAVNLKGAEHLTPTDAVWLAKGAIKTGSMGAEKTIEALRNYVAAFIDANLRGRQFDPLLTGPSSDYPDAEVTTETQSMCSKAIDH